MTDTRALIRQLTTQLTAPLASDLGARVAERQRCLLVDTSGSMNDPVQRESGQYERKIDALRRVAQLVRQDLPTLLVIGFGHGIGRVPDEIPEPGGGTPLTEALRYARVDEGCTTVVLISDGLPDAPHSALLEAQRFARIDTFFVGPTGDAGERFLERLSKSTGGMHQQTDLAAPKQLATRIRGLLVSGTCTTSRNA